MDSPLTGLGRVYLVGAGPGDPELITVKGRRLVEQCEALVYDLLLPTEMLAWAPATAERHFVGKQPGRHTLPQSEIQALLIRLSREGKQVVRLKGGDPFVFGRGGEEAAALNAAGIPFEVVPAVTSALGCAAYAGIPLTHREHAGLVTFVSGHECAERGAEDAVNWEQLAKTGGTLVLYMSMGRLSAIVEALIRGGLDEDTPACVVEWGTTPRQRTLRARLRGLAAAVEERKMGPPSIVIVGEVAGLADSLAWFDPAI